MSANPEKIAELRRAVDDAQEWAPPNEGPAHQDAQRQVSAEDFYSYLPLRKFIFTETRELWPATSVNARCPPLVGDRGQPVKPSDWIDRNHAVEQMTWAPGEPMIIADRLVADGGWIPRTGCATFNLYRPALPMAGDPNQAGRWREHIRAVFPDDVAHIVKWLAHRVQRPAEKINHALVLGGNPGIGKDTLLEPVKHGVGPWNFAETSPTHLLGRFNGFIKSVILRISEARDLGDMDRFAFYDHMKVYTAAPPDVLRCDEKNTREHAVFNVTGVIITSNHKTDGIYLPSDDRRHYVAWSDLSKEDFSADYWKSLYAWYASGGTGHVVAYLRTLDLTGFDPKAPPPKTEAFHAIADANRAPEDAEMSDALDTLNASRQSRGDAVPVPAVTLQDIVDYTTADAFREWLQDRRNRRKIPHRLEAAGYVPVRNDADRHDGQWKVRGRRQTIYALRSLSVRDRIGAAIALSQPERM